MMNHSITVISLGPGNPDLLTLQASELLRQRQRLYLRTDHHPVAQWLQQQEISYQSFDALYDLFEDFDALHAEIAKQLCTAATQQEGALLYAVPDPTSDLSLTALFALAKKKRIVVQLLPGVGHAEDYLSRLGRVYNGCGYRVLSASNLMQGSWSPSVNTLITELNDAITAGDVKLFLADLLEDETPVYYLCGEEKPKKIALWELDHQKHLDHTSCVYLPGLTALERKRNTVEDLQYIMKRLRGQGGCPWDQEQTHESLRPYLVEEAWESVNAIDDADMDHLSDELGDVLLQIVFHASIGESFEEFNLTDVATHICQKMILRHPHVFGDAHCENAAQVSDTWETIKQQETGSHTIGESLNDVSEGLPALKYAIKVLKKIMHLPAWQHSIQTLQQEIGQCAGELIDSHGQLEPKVLGKLLLSCAELCHMQQEDCEILLHQAVRELVKAYQAMEAQVLREGLKPEELTAEQLAQYLKTACSTN